MFPLRRGRVLNNLKTGRWNDVRPRRGGPVIPLCRGRIYDNLHSGWSNNTSWWQGFYHQRGCIFCPCSNYATIIHQPCLCGVRCPGGIGHPWKLCCRHRRCNGVHPWKWYGTAGIGVSAMMCSLFCHPCCCCFCCHNLCE
jgi:hypothetical protein